VRPFAHWLVVVQSDACGPPPASVQLTPPVVLFEMSHVSFAAQPHCGSSPHALLGGVVTHDPVPPELDELVDPPELDVDDPPELEVDEPPELDVDAPPELEVEPPLLPPLLPPDDPPELDVPGSGSGSGSGSPLDEVDPGEGTFTLGSSGSVGSFWVFVVVPPVGSASVAPCAQAARPSVPKRSVPPKMRPRLLIEPGVLTRVNHGSLVGERVRRTRDVRNVRVFMDTSRGAQAG
jgi:hypothetical protein